MAFLRDKRPQSKYFVARFRDINGKPRDRSTKTTNRKLAQKIADMWEEAYTKRRTIRQFREVLAEAHELITGEKPIVKSFREFSESWIAKKKAEVSPATFEFYSKSKDKFVKFLGGKADLEITEIGSDDIVAFRTEIAKSIAPVTVNHHLTFVKMVFNAARESKLISDSPAEFVKGVRDRSVRTRRPFTIPELKAVLEVADDEWRSMTLFGLYTGQRLLDITSLKVSNIDLKKEIVRLITSKTGKRIICPIAGPLKKHILSLKLSKNPNDLLHPRSYEIFKRHGRTSALSKQFYELMVKAGLREKRDHQQTHGKGRDAARASLGLSYHCLRHTTSSMLEYAGISRSTKMELIGHDDKDTSDDYTHVGMEALIKAAESLPDIT